MGLTNPSQVTALEYVASTKISGPLAQQIKSQTHERPYDNAIRAVKQEMSQVKNQYLKEKPLRKVRLVSLPFFQLEIWTLI